MTKEGLEKEAEEWVISNTEIYDDKFGIECENEPQAKVAYLAGAEPREKQLREKDKKIAELEAQIEKMKCCGNCHHHFFNSYDVMECAEGLNVTSKHCDKWECRL